MIVIILILIIFAVRKAEREWGSFAINALRVHRKCDSIVAEPGQPVTWSATVENHSRRPISFVRLIERFPDQVDVLMEETWLQKHRKECVLSWICLSIACLTAVEHSSNAPLLAAMLLCALSACSAWEVHDRPQPPVLLAAVFESVSCRQDHHIEKRQKRQ